MLLTLYMIILVGLDHYLTSLCLLNYSNNIKLINDIDEGKLKAKSNPCLK